MSLSFQGRAAAGVLFSLVLLVPPALARPSAAQELAALKTEVQTLADQQAYPIGGINKDDVRTVLASLKSTDPDAWAAAWSAMGAKHAANAPTEVDPALARKAWHQAWLDYMFAAWPSPRSAGQRAAYQKSVEAFRQYAKLLQWPVETVRIPFAGKTIVGYLQLPKSSRPVPAVISIGGLDAYKEYSVVHTSPAFLEAGLASFAIDMPGTGEAPVKMEPGAENMILAVIDYLSKRPEIDPKRIAVNGMGDGGYWAALTAYVARDRIAAAVVRGAPIHYYFLPHWQFKSWNSGDNELFDRKDLRMSLYGFKPDQEREFFAALRPFSLQVRGLLDEPSAPMLLVNGAKDTQVPIDDLYLLLHTGSPKYAWVNPVGGHDGQSADWSDDKITDKVVTPWLVTMLDPAAQ